MEKVNIEEREKMALSNFKAGYNCAQSVILAYADYFEVEREAIATVASAFGGGIGGLREVCGAVSGMAMAAGYIIPATDTSNTVAKSENKALTQRFAEEFRRANGSIICRDLLGLSPNNKPLNEQKKRPCAELVVMAARIIGEGINQRA